MANRNLTLTEVFHLFNSRYFGAHLPKNTRVMWMDLKEDNCLGYYEKGHKILARRVRGKDKGTFRVASEKRDTIVIDRNLKKMNRIANATLLHEMVHLKLRNKDRGDGHGHLFQREMKRLVKLGAFHYLW